MLTLSYDLSPTRATQLGLIVLQADETIEQDMRRLLPADVELLVSRVPSGTHVTQDSLAAMETELTRAASLFPAGARLSAVGYGCTSGSAQIGAGRVADKIKAGITTDHVSDPVSALIAACKAMNIRRLGLLSPYVASVSDRLRETLQQAGITVSAFASFDVSQESRVVRITPESITDAAIQLTKSDQMDGLFISCTNLRTLDIIADVEARIGKPVLTSNQVLAWDLLRLAQAKSPDGFVGRLGQVSG